MPGPDTSTARLLLVVIILMALLATVSAVWDMRPLDWIIAVGLWGCAGLMAFGGAAKKTQS
jgi:hypothetical protein